MNFFGYFQGKEASTGENSGTEEEVNASKSPKEGQVRKQQDEIVE